MLTQKELVSELKQLIKDQEIFIDKDGDLLIFNDRMDQYEVFDGIADIINSAIHHRTFQQCI